MPILTARFDFTVEIVIFNRKFYSRMFFSRTFRLWNSSDFLIPNIGVMCLFWILFNKICHLSSIRFYLFNSFSVTRLLLNGFTPLFGVKWFKRTIFPYFPTFQFSQQIISLDVLCRLNIISLKYSLKTDRNGNLKMQFVLNTKDEWKRFNQTETIFTWSPKTMQSSVILIKYSSSHSCD